MAPMALQISARIQGDYQGQALLSFRTFWICERTVCSSDPYSSASLPTCIFWVKGLRNFVICEQNIRSSAPPYSASPPSYSFRVKHARILPAIDKSLDCDRRFNCC
jgi:hypothetical protein